MENPESLGNLLTYGALWAFIALCVFLVARWALLFVAVVLLGLSDRYDRLPGPVRRWLLARVARHGDARAAE